MAAPSVRDDLLDKNTDIPSQADVDDGCNEFETNPNGPETFFDVLTDFANIQPPSPPSKRSFCSRCSRPMTVCWCPFLPRVPIDVSTTVCVLQHPFEESRRLRTAPMLSLSLVPEKCQIVRGKRFSKERYPWVWDLLHSPNTLLLYPCPGATDISELSTPEGTGISYNLLILDGTWSQAKGMYHQNPALHQIKKVQISQGYKSKYVIHTQPTDACLSTVETAAIALSILENKPSLEQVLTRPLVALCDFQLKFGAVPHDSRQYQIENGTYTKALPKSMLKKRDRMNKQLKEL